MGKGSKKDKSVYNALPDTTTTGTDTDTSVDLLPARSSSKKKKRSRDKYDDSDDFDGFNGLERKPSPVVAPLPTLNEKEYEVFDKVGSGDVDAVKAVIGNMNVNKTNRLGYTVLHVAVNRQDEAMIKYLLEQPGIQLYDTILHAIREKNKGITELLLGVYDKEETDDKKQRFVSSLGSGELRDSEIEAVVSSAGAQGKPTSSPISGMSGVKSSIRRKERPRFGPPAKSGSSKSPRSNNNLASSSVALWGEVEEDIPFDSEFSPVITPLMLAAQVGSYTLMELFYSRNERLETSEFHHNLGCQCDICAKLDGDQDMTRAHQRYQLYKSICKPEYICFMTRKEKIDPVNYAIDKIVKLRDICERDLAYDRTYEKFITQLETFLHDLVSLCRNTRETEIFLSPKDSAGSERLPHLYPRLWYTVGLELKNFVSEPNVQNIVYKIWAADDWPEWDSNGAVYRGINFFIRLLLFPVVPLLLFFLHGTKIGKILGSPLSRFMTYIGSYVWFLALVTIQVIFPYQRCNNEPPYYQVRDESCKFRGPPNIGTEKFIIAYVLGFYFSTLKRSRVGWYWRCRWNWFDMAGQIAFTCVFACWGWAFIWVRRPDNEQLIDANERLAWPHNCAEIVGECLLAIASMLAFGRLLRFFLVLPNIGEIQIGLGAQITDFFGAGLLYVAVLLAFSSGLLALYVPYKGFEGVDENNVRKKQDETFMSISSTMQNLFWYLYGHGGKDPANLLTYDPNNNSSTATSEPNKKDDAAEDNSERIHHDYTEYAGTALYTAYHVIGQMMMFNMLSGYFSHTMNSLQEAITTHWKFARTELYLTFVKDTVQPPPFNLFGTIAILGRGLTFIKLLFSRKKEGPQAQCSLNECCFITHGDKLLRWKALMKGYRKLMLELMYRYGNFAEENNEESPASRHDVLEIGEELAELRSILKSKLNESGSKNESSSSDDDGDDGGGGTGWAKTKSVIDKSGSAFLRNAMSKEAQTRAGSAITTQPTSGTGAGFTKSAAMSSVGESRSTKSQRVAQPTPTNSIKPAALSRKQSEKGKQTGSGITTVFPPQPPSLPKSPTVPPSATALGLSTSGMGMGMGNDKNKNVPSKQSLSKAKSVPIEKTITTGKTTATLKKSAPALSSTLTRSTSQFAGESAGKVPILPKPLSMKTMTTDDSETTDGMGPPIKSNILLKTMSKSKTGP